LRSVMRCGLWQSMPILGCDGVPDVEDRMARLARDVLEHLRRVGSITMKRHLFGPGRGRPQPVQQHEERHDQPCDEELDPALQTKGRG